MHIHLPDACMPFLFPPRSLRPRPPIGRSRWYPRPLTISAFPELWTKLLTVPVACYDTDGLSIDEQRGTVNIRHIWLNFLRRSPKWRTPGRYKVRSRYSIHDYGRLRLVSTSMYWLYAMMLCMFVLCRCPIIILPSLSCFPECSRFPHRTGFDFPLFTLRCPFIFAPSPLQTRSCF